VVVAVSAVRMVQMAIHQVINMVAMRHGFVAAVGAMSVRVLGGTAIVRSAYLHALAGVWSLVLEELVTNNKVSIHLSNTIADYLLTRLAELGVHHMFGVPGDFNLWFLEHLITKSDVKFVGCCNELNAAYAADGCARLAGVSVLATTYGVGELASLAGVAGAYAERVPIVCITGAPPVHATRERALLHHTLADGNFDNMLNCYREFTIAQARIEPATARNEIDRVLRTCWLQKPRHGILTTTAA
jgi:hypothetical protein